MSLLELAIEKTLNLKDFLQEQKETTLIFAGNKGAGKTTLINLLLEKNEPPKPTLALDYTFGRRSGKSLNRDVSHIWELGGGSAYTSLLSAPLAAANRLESASLVLVLDLSRPQQLWSVLEAVTASVRELTTHLTEMEPQPSLLQERAWERLGETLRDEVFINPFPIPLIIIGCKYDLFQDLESEKKKVVCRCLRYVALSLGASLYFFSSKDSGVAKRTKDVLSHHAFGTPAPKTICQDVSKPLSVPCGSETLQLIGGPGPIPTFKSHGTAMERWRVTYTALFPQEEAAVAEIPEDPSMDPNFAEPEIDKMKAQKDQELEKYRQETSKRKQHRH